MEKRRKKVMYLITKANFGGAQRYVFDLATHIDGSEYEAVVVAGGEGELLQALGHQHIRTISLPSLQNTLAPRLALQSLRELYTLLKVERPDILHSNSSVAGLLGSIVGRALRIPRIIFTAHGWSFNEDRPWYQKILFIVLHSLTVLLSHRTIAVSQAVIDQLPLPGKEKKMKIVYPGRTIGPMYEQTDARTHLTEVHQTLAAYPNDFWIGHIAELHPIKNQLLLIRMMETIVREHPTTRLIIIGEGTERTHLQTEITARGLSEHVFLVGALFEAARFLKAFNLFVLPSRSESYGYVIHEAGIASVPVVATSVGGIPEVITNGVSGFLVPDNDLQAFTRAVLCLMTDTALAHKYAQALKESVTPRTLARMVDATATLYRL